MADNQYGRVSCLDIELINKNGTTNMGRTRFTAPFKVMKPFASGRNENEILNLMILSSSAGIMAGDEQEITVRMGSHTAAEINSQSYEKIHKMPEGEAHRHTSLVLAANSFCYYNPLPVIPFADSAFTSETDISLEDRSSVLIYREIIAGGRGAYGECFAYRKYENRVRIRVDSELLYYDNTILEPETKTGSPQGSGNGMDPRGYGLLEGYSHMGNMIFCNLPFNSEALKMVRQKIEDAGGCAGISRPDEGLTVLRMFATRADDIIRFFDMIYGLIPLTGL